VRHYRFRAMRFDTAIEVTISRLRIELMFPAGDAA